MSRSSRSRCRWSFVYRDRLIRANVPELVARGATVVRGDYDEGVLETTSSCWT
jgi:hypothetical protein